MFMQFSSDLSGELIKKGYDIPQARKLIPQRHT